MSLWARVHGEQVEVLGQTIRQTDRLTACTTDAADFVRRGKGERERERERWRCRYLGGHRLLYGFTLYANSENSQCSQWVLAVSPTDAGSVAQGRRWLTACACVCDVCVCLGLC